MLGLGGTLLPPVGWGVKDEARDIELTGVFNKRRVVDDLLEDPEGLEGSVGDSIAGGHF